MFAFYQQGNAEYFGISFQGKELFKNRHSYPYVWQVARKFHGDLPPSAASYITCRYPIIPGTFVPIAAPVEQLQVFRHLLAIADYIETNDLLLLDQEYENFVRQYGLVSNYRSYFEGVWWIDLRLCALFSSLEKTVKAESSNRRIVRTKRPVQDNEPVYALGDEPLELTMALEKCISWYGKVDLSKISKMSNLPELVVEERLREMKLIFREDES